MATLIGQHLGPYEIISLLGQGGMATVYRARQTMAGRVQREVAVKVIEARLTQSAEFMSRFEREAQTVMSLSHAHILKVFDYGQANEVVYLVMELLSGGSLSDRMRRDTLTLEVVERLLTQVASALDYAHSKGIIHRDLKPQNVLLDESENAFLTDFGIVKLLNETTGLTQSGMTVGTPTYMSPEQWQGGTIDARSDVYSLGVMLFEMLSGSAPFRGDTPFRMMHMHIFEPPPLLSQSHKELPAALDDVLQTALAKDAANRFPTAKALVNAFRLALGGQPVQNMLTGAAGAMPLSVSSGSLVMRSSVYLDGPTLPPKGSDPQRATPARRSFWWVGATIAVVAVVGLGASVMSGRGNSPTNPTVSVLAGSSTDVPPATSQITHTTTLTVIHPTIIASEPPRALAVVAVAASEMSTAMPPAPSATQTSAPSPTTPPPTSTFTATLIPTAVAIVAAPSATNSSVPSATALPQSATSSPLPTETAQPSVTLTARPTQTHTPTTSYTPTASATSTFTPSLTATMTMIASTTPTATPTLTESVTATLTSTATSTETVTATSTVNDTATMTQSPTATVYPLTIKSSVRLRSGPGTAYTLLFTMDASSKELKTAIIIGRGPIGYSDWYLVQWTTAKGEVKVGWVNLAVLGVTPELTLLPTIGGTKFPPTPRTVTRTPTPLPIPTAPPQQQQQQQPSNPEPTSESQPTSGPVSTT